MKENRLGIELRPCPFCGEEVELKEFGSWVVVCKKCSYQLSLGSDGERISDI